MFTIISIYGLGVVLLLLATNLNPRFREELKKHNLINDAQDVLVWPYWLIIKPIVKLVKKYS